MEEDVALAAEKLGLPLNDEVDADQSDESAYYSDYEDD